jgi:hypothetical protein
MLYCPIADLFPDVDADGWSEYYSPIANAFPHADADGQSEY